VPDEASSAARDLPPLGIPRRMRVFLLSMKPAITRRFYLAILLVAAAACACAHHGPASSASATAPAAGEIKVEVTSVGIDRDTGAHYVLLEDRAQSRGLPILIGDNEAEAILLELHGLKPPRPMTQDLLRSVIEQTGNHVDAIVISDLHDEVYYAKILLDGGHHSIDSRPSDAIALAMGTNAPIYVNQKLLEPASELQMGKVVRFPRSEHGFGITVQDVTPNLAAYFGVAPGTAVLVSEADSGARRAGVQRGDLVTQIDGKPVSGLDDFDSHVAMVKAGEQVTLTVKRADGEHSIVVKPQDSADN
jgi:bifunctional DNase/RNase